jgi:acyl-CoA thioester hydrolase
LTKARRDTNIGPLLASCKCDFKRILHYPGEISILSSVDFIWNTSFSICHNRLNEKVEIAAETQDIMVMFDFNRK